MTAPVQPKARTRVLYVAGTGRSGSTVFANVLGEVAQCASVGELRYLWQRGMVEDRLCGCGATFSECGFWKGIRDDAGVGTAIYARTVAAKLARMLRIRALPSLLRARRSEAFARSWLGGLADRLSRLYATAVAHGGGTVVIDSSKLPSYAALLDLLPDLEITVVHLVRDPRAAAHSWTRRKELPDHRVPALMERRGVVKSAVLWTIWNALLERWWRDKPDRYVRVRYEDFVTSPEQVVHDVLAYAGVPTDPSAGPFQPGEPGAATTDGATVLLGTHHTVAGNPARYTDGVVALVRDDEWRAAMPLLERLGVVAVAFRWMRRYGYPVRTPRKQPARVEQRPRETG